MELNFLHATDLLFSMVTSTETAHFEECWKSLFCSQQGNVDSSENPISVSGSDSSRHSNQHSQEVQIIFLI